MRLSKRSLLAVPLSVLALIGGLLVAGPMGIAQAAVGPTIAFSPSGPFASGDTVTVNVTGFAAYAPVAVSQCPTGRAILGPGDCGRSISGAAKLITVNASGAGSATLTVRTGTLGNRTAPSAICDAAHACDFVAVNIADETKTVRTAIPFAPITGPWITYTPSGPFVAGNLVTVSVTGFTPSADVAIGQCPTGRAVAGDGDCGRMSDGAAALITADGSGAGSAALTIRVGALNNLTAPAATCGPLDACDFVATEVGQPAHQARIEIPYVYDDDEEPCDEFCEEPCDEFCEEPGPFQELTMTPGGAVKDGTKVSVVATGFTPYAPVHIGQCGLRPIFGPGDCGQAKAGLARHTLADAKGVARATLTLAYGPLGNATTPAITCSEVRLCLVAAINITDSNQQAAVPVFFTGKLVKPKVSITLSKAKVKKGTRVTFRGTVSPNAGGERVLLQRKEKKGWVTKAKATVSVTSKYTVRWKPSSKTDYKWRVKIVAKKWHPSSTSKSRKLKVT